MKHVFSIFFILTLILLSSCRAKTPVEALKRDRVNDLKAFHANGSNLKTKVMGEDTYLTYAIKHNSEDVALWLIENKILNINAQDDMYNTPIMLAYKLNRQPIFEALLKQPKIKLNISNFNEERLITMVAERGDFNTFSRLVKKYPVKIHFRVKDGVYQNGSLLHFAIKGMNIDIIKYLRKKKFRFHYKSTELNPIILAASTGNLEVMTYLESIGLNMNTKGHDGWTPLMSAAKSGNEGAVMLLLGYGAKVNAKSSFHWTALMSAVLSNNLEIVKILVESGAKTSVRNYDKKTALDLSIEQKSTDITNYLKSLKNPKK